jgi:hypothetical protein
MNASMNVIVNVVYVGGKQHPRNLSSFDEDPVINGIYLYQLLGASSWQAALFVAIDSQKGG